MTASRILCALVLALAGSGSAIAQDQSQDQDQEQPGAPDQSGDQANPGPAPAASDPVAALAGIWRVDHAEGSAAADGSLMGRIIRIGPAAVPSLTAGTCTNPGFVPSGDAAGTKVEITCLGQVLATAQWSADQADTVNWSEANLQAVLHRVASAAELSGAGQGADQGGGQGNDQGSGGDANDNGSDGSGDAQ